MDPYEILGIPPGASDAEIKKAYRKRVKQFHPDRNRSEEAAHRILMINAAYDVLSDPVKRAQYDRPPYVETPVYEEDPVEVYQREFKRRRWEQEQREKAEKLARAKKIYRIVRLANMPILAFALAVIIDNVLPRNTYVETPIAGEETRGTDEDRIFHTHMRTSRFRIEVPSEFHRSYPYRSPDKPLVTISMTPLFNVPRTVACTLRGRDLDIEVPGTVHNNFLRLPWLLLFSSVLFVARKEFSRDLYLISFVPFLLLIMTLILVL